MKSSMCSDKVSKTSPFLKVVFVIVLALQAACAGTIHGKSVKSNPERDELFAKAEAGDAEAQ